MVDLRDQQPSLAGCPPPARERSRQLRPGSVSVTGWDGRVVYEAPPPEEVPGLVERLVDRLRKPDPVEDEIVWAAMAHINLLAIHPYQGANGRVARLLQSLVLAREGPLTPELGSIEVYLGSRTQGCHEALHAVHGSTFDPKRGPSRWLDFCMEAHRQEALRLRDRLDLSEAQTLLSAQQVSRQRFPDRFAIPLALSLAGLAYRVLP